MRCEQCMKEDNAVKNCSKCGRKLCRRCMIGNSCIDCMVMEDKIMVMDYYKEKYLNGLKT